MVANTAKLMNGRASTDNDPVADDHMATQHDIVREDDIVANLAIVGDVRIGQKHRPVANDGLSTCIRHAGVHGDSFADRAAGTDGKSGFLTLVSNVLRFATQNCTGKHTGVASDARSAGHRHVAFQHHPFRQRDIGPDMAERPDCHVRGDCRTVLDNR